MKQITAQLTVKALHETFCRFGMPESMKTDNSPQFVSSELQNFCQQFGIQHRRTTPYWPQANGEVERINRCIVKRLKISQTNSSDWQWDLRTFILMHNSTPHSTTGVAPSVLLFGRRMKDKLPGLLIRGSNILEEIRDRDHLKKIRGAEYADYRRSAKPSEISQGDVVVTKRIQKENKLSTMYDPEEYTVVDRNGPDIKLKSKESGKIIHRNVSHLKKLFSGTMDSDNNIDEADVTEGVEEPTQINPNLTSTNENEAVTENIRYRDLSKTRLDEGVTSGVTSRAKREVRQPLYFKDYKIGTINQF